jgi:hypothetical protein
MAVKAQQTATAAPAAVVGTASANAGTPPLATGTATSRVPVANLEAIALSKAALEKIADAINESVIAVRRTQEGGRVKVTPEQVQVVLAAVLS